MNRLQSEKSPYLRQHIDNPVNWYPWGEEAFSRARDENKLIFLSIGYSTCHWCHVMAHECFEDQDVADLLNADYLSIKVDREERPDIDQVYMEVCQRLTGSGGWPLTIVMTPQAEPFYAATYVPKHGRHGRPGLMDLLPWLTNKWREEPELLVKAAGEVLTELHKRATQPPGEGIDASMHAVAERALKKGFDARYGGFGRAPKFPRPHDLAFLLQRYHHHGDTDCLEIVEKTLRQMRSGGIYDQFGGGFHRYSTDEKWLVPHFEKMLYDQAGLVEVYLGAWQATGKVWYAETARAVLEYLSRDMLSPLGGFYSAEDADSEGEEGTFYLWDKNEIVQLLGDQSEAFCELYNISAQGNYHDEVSGRFTGKNIPHLSEWSSNALEQNAAARQKLFDVRCQRIRPHLDDKVIAAWNGMAISAFATAGQCFADDGYLKTARGAADFILDRLLVDGHRLLRRYRDGEAAIHAFSEDYAYVARGLLDLYRCDYDTRWLTHAIALAETVVNFFLDPQSGRLYDTPHDGEQLLVRPCSTFDGAVPAASSVAVEVFARLYKLTGNSDWLASAESLMQALSADVARYPAGYTHLLRASNWLLHPGMEVVIVAGAQEGDLRCLMAAIPEHARDRLVVLVKTEDNAEELARIAPFTAEMQPVEGMAAAYVCQGFSCHRPVTDPDDLMELLADG